MSLQMKTKKRERLERLNFYKSVGIKKISNLSKRELFLVGAALYWAEGGKTQRKVVFINSNPEMILLWIEWITVCLNISKERLIFRIEINEICKNNLKKIEKYWLNLIKISISQFRKPSLKHSKNKKIYKDNYNYYGSLQITVAKGTNLNYEILGYIEGLANNINGKT